MYAINKSAKRRQQPGYANNKRTAWQSNNNQQYGYYSHPPEGVDGGPQHLQQMRGLGHQARGKGTRQIVNSFCLPAGSVREKTAEEQELISMKIKLPHVNSQQCSPFLYWLQRAEDGVRAARSAAFTYYMARAGGVKTNEDWMAVSIQMLFSLQPVRIPAPGTGRSPDRWKRTPNQCSPKGHRASRKKRTRA